MRVWIEKLVFLSFVILIEIVAPNKSEATPIRFIPNLKSITIWERTGGPGPNPYVLDVNSVELTTRLSDPLAPNNKDFMGAYTEFYDVYYSNADGTFNIDGEYLSITAVFGMTYPAGGGLNLAEVELNFFSGESEYGSFVSSYAALGDNAEPASVIFAVDGDLQTHTTMGNTVGLSERLRVTLGFLSSAGPVPEPSTLMLLGTGFAAVLFVKRKRK